MDSYVERIEERLKELGISRNEAERRGGLKKNYLRDILDEDPRRGGRRSPGLAMIPLICKGLDATPDELFPEIEALYSERQLRYIRETNLADRRIRELEKDLKS